MTVPDCAQWCSFRDVKKPAKTAAKADKPAVAKASKQTIVINIEEYNELLNYKKRFEAIQGLLK